MRATNVNTKHIQKITKEQLINAFPFLANERLQAFITITLTLIALSIFGIFAINPTVSTILQLQKQLADDTSVANALQQKITNLATLQQQYGMIQNQLVLAFVAVPLDAQISRFVGQIQTLGQKTSIKIDRIQTGELPVVNTFSQQPNSFDFTIIANGRTDAITNFLNALVHFERIILIDNLSTNQTITGTTGQVQLTITGRAFFKQ